MFSLLAKKPWYLLALPVAVLLGVLGYRGGIGLHAGGGGNAELAAVGAGAEVTTANGFSSGPAQPEVAASTAIGPGLPVDLRAVFERGRDLYAFARELRAAADAGDAEAAWMVSRIHDYCGVYAMDPRGYALDSSTLASMGLSDVPGLNAARERVSVGCVGFTAADAIGRGVILQERQQAAAAGNLAAEAALLAMGEPLKRDADYRRGLVERVLNSQDPEAFLAVSSAMGVTAAGDDAYRGMVAGDQFSQLAWQVAACRLGLACGPNSMLMTSYCANGGICSKDPGQDFESFVYDAAVPRQSEGRMNQLVDSLRGARGGKR